MGSAGNGVPPSGGGPARWSRRGLLRAGAVLALSVPLGAAACTTQRTPPPPDPLQPMLDSATGDAATAKAAAAAFPGNAATLGVIASVRAQQAAALRTEVNRAAAVTATTTPTATSAVPKPASEGAVTSQLMRDMAAAQRQAAALLPKLPRYRAGLVGSVAAGCASLTEALDNTPITASTATSKATTIDPEAESANGSSSAATQTTAPDAAGPPLAGDTADALQQALSTAHAALWMYGTASAFVTGTASGEIIAAMDSVRILRDATEQSLTAGGVTPQLAQAAYLTPTPVTNQASALTALGMAESDGTVAWRGVLERTDDADVRADALAALVDCAVRQTRWRRLSGQSPASVPMPGKSA